MPTRKSLEIAQVSFRQYRDTPKPASWFSRDPLIFKGLGLVFCCSSPPPMLLFLKCSKNSKEVVPSGWGSAQTWAKNLHQIPVTSTSASSSSVHWLVWPNKGEETPGLLLTCRAVESCTHEAGHGFASRAVRNWGNFCKSPLKAGVMSVYSNDAWLGKTQMWLIIQIFLLY